MSRADDLAESARALVVAGRLQEAVVACDDLNRQFPDYAPGWYISSRMATMVGDTLLALQAIERALYLSPGNPEWILQRVECLGAAGDNAAASALAQELAAHSFDSARSAAHFGRVLSSLGLFEEARDQYRRACELEPGGASHYSGLAAVWRALGDLDEAHSALDKCLQIEPDNATAMLQRARLRQQTRERNNIADLEAAYQRAAGNPSLRSPICYALSKELADVGEFERSFDVLSEGAALQREIVAYNPASDLEALRAIPGCYGADMFSRGIEGHISAEPIFLVGMPLSGVALVERILARHPAVQTVGEHGIFAHKLMMHCQRVPGPAITSTTEMVSRSTEIDFSALGEEYLESTRSTIGRKPHFVDGRPFNFQYAGLIHLALPKARIVLLQRDPMDNCYAMFRTPFDDRYSFTCDLTQLADFYAAYNSVMDHWQRVMPGVIHVVQYEELITEPKPVVERLLEHCSLSLNEDCLNAAVPGNETIGISRDFAARLEPVAAVLREAGVRLGE